MSGTKTAIVTGGNQGLGKETARQLAKAGLRVILACRDPAKAEAARQDIIQDTQNQNVSAELLDLASLRSVEEFAKKINNGEERVDILINNAGVYTNARQETADGFELHFGVNYLGHFYLTYLLLDKMKASAPSRVVILSAEGHKFGGCGVDFEDLQFTKGYTSFKAVGRSKTCTILFGIHLAKVLQGTGVTTYSLHPGLIQTEIFRENRNTCMMRCFKPLMGCMAISVEDGVATTMYCALDPSLDDQTGLYYMDSKVKKTVRHATDPEQAEKLWNISLELCGISSEEKTNISSDL